MADLLASIRRLTFDMQLPRQTQETPTVLCCQCNYFVTFLSAGGNLMPLFEQLYHQSQT